MEPFREILEALGAKHITPIKESEHWDFWEAKYQTPVTSVSGYLSSGTQNPPLMGT